MKGRRVKAGRKEASGATELHAVMIEIWHRLMSRGYRLCCPIQTQERAPVIPSHFIPTVRVRTRWQARMKKGPAMSSAMSQCRNVCHALVCLGPLRGAEGGTGAGGLG